MSYTILLYSIEYIKQLWSDDHRCIPFVSNDFHREYHRQLLCILFKSENNATGSQMLFIHLVVLNKKTQVNEFTGAFFLFQHTKESTNNNLWKSKNVGVIALIRVRGYFIRSSLLLLFLFVLFFFFFWLTINN